MQPFVIPVKGLDAGKCHYDWHADGSFFETFGNSEIEDADLEISVDVNNADFSVEVKCSVKGFVTVACDRCLEPLKIPVETSFEEEDVLDLNQDIYDYVCTSLPFQKIHPEGGCNEDMVKYLSK